MPADGSSVPAPADPLSPPDESPELVPPPPDEYLLPAPCDPPLPCRNTAHQYAGWLAVYRPLCTPMDLDPDTRHQFPPHRSDLDALDAARVARLRDLRAAGARPLASESAFRRALACRPHAFAYGGEGRPCRFWFCPYCAGAEAGEAFLRLRRARAEHGAEFGFYVSHARFVVPRARCGAVAAALLSRTPLAVNEVPGVRVIGDGFDPWETGHSLVRVGLHPLTKFNDDEDRMAVSVRTLSAVPREQANRVLADRRDQEARLRKSLRQFLARQRGGREPSVDDEYFPATPQRSTTGYVVRPTPVAEARAAAHLCRYPAEVLTAPVAHAAAVLNLAAGMRQSTAHGLFRSASAVRPAGERPVYVPVCTGAGIVGPLLPLIPNPPEALAARGFAHELGLPTADTFAAVGAALGWPCYWLGSYEMRAVEQFGL